MPGAAANLPQPRGFKGWTDWAGAVVTTLNALLNRTQKIDEEYEPPFAAGSASRIVMRDANGVRYAVTISTAGAVVVTAL